MPMPILPGLDLEELRSGKAVVRPLPFALDFHSALWRRVPPTGVGPGQRADTGLRQDGHVHRDFLESRRVRNGVGVTAGQTIDGTLDRVHRHVELLSMNAVGHHCAHANPAVTRSKIHPGARLNLTLLSQFW